VVEISQEFSSNSRVKSISLEIEEEDSMRERINIKEYKKSKPKFERKKIHKNLQQSKHYQNQSPPHQQQSNKAPSKQTLQSGNECLSNFMSFKDGFNSEPQNFDFETNSLSSNKFGVNTSSIAQQSFTNNQTLSKSKIQHNVRY
jgi:hypothetical protein